MQLIVSSSLEGRDLALLKSVINILHSDYIDDSDCNWFYSDDSKHQIFIAQDFYQNGSEYYALIKEHDKRVHIGTRINPQNLRKLFNNIAANKLSCELDKDDSAICNDYPTLLVQIHRYISSKSQINMCMMVNASFKIAINKQQNEVISNVALNEFFIKNTLIKGETVIDYRSCEKAYQSKEMKYRMKASHFLWRLGLHLSDQLVKPEFTQLHITFKQVKWPDYGSIEFKNSFISMSALLWRRAESFQSLCHNHHFKKSEVILFLNAMCLSAAASVNTMSKNIVVSKKPRLKPVGLLSKLKHHFFGRRS